MKSPIALLASLLVDFKRLNPGVNGLDRDLETIERRVEHEGLSFLTVTLPSLDDALIKALSSGRFTCPMGFKKIPGGAIPRFLSGMLCKVFDSNTGLLIEPIEYGILRDVHTFLRLFKKTGLGSDDEELLHQKAVDEFYQCDVTASQVIIPDRHNHLIGHVGRYILSTLYQKDLENESIYKHGPGAVEESYRGNQKWLHLYHELRDFARVPEWFGHTNFRNLYYRFGFDRSGVLEVPGPLHGNAIERELGSCDESGQVPHGDSSPQDVRRSLRQPCQGYRNDQLLGPDESLGSGIQSECRQRGASARLISVLKNSTSRRTITIEPMLRMYMQQGLNTLLRESITECRVLRNCLALTDQSKNQKLALEGSLTGKWATIDLKSASDLLSLTLVKSVFRHHSEFLECLMDCRSPYVHTNGLNKPQIELGKFAGMGNATTFPVQSICFAVIGIAAILDVMGRRPTYWNVERASRQVRVYGDDIIIHSDYAHQVVKWLHDVGLKVNVKKSFLEGNFRESCGVEAFRGVEITPLYIRHWPHQIDESPNVCAHLVSLSNHMWLQGLYKASDYLRDVVEGYLGNALPLVSLRSGSLGWHTRLDAIEPHKWCSRTHQFLTRTFALAPVKIRDRLDGYPALLKSLTTPLLGRDKDHLDRTTRRFHNRLVRRWVPSYSYDGLNLQA